MTFYKRWFCQN